MNAPVFGRIKHTQTMYKKNNNWYMAASPCFHHSQTSCLYHSQIMSQNVTTNLNKIFYNITHENIQYEYMIDDLCKHDFDISHM